MLVLVACARCLVLVLVLLPCCLESVKCSQIVLALRLTILFESFVKACSGVGIVLMVVLVRVL